SRRSSAASDVYKRQSHGRPAMYYDKYSSGAKAYLALAGEIIRRDELAREQA
ncbi:ParA family protein, partial [Vibrio harveyi]|uniref:ParA family protein n=1 Tax=Vibrio harveyi TaxID=669 RepID=UPI0036F37A9B